MAQKNRKIRGIRDNSHVWVREQTRAPLHQDYLTQILGYPAVLVHIKSIHDGGIGYYGPHQPLHLPI